MPKTRNIIIFAVIGVALILIYIFFIKPSPDQATLVSSTPTTSLPGAGGTTAGTPGATTIATEDFLALLLSVKNIKLDISILSDIAFNSLQNSSIELKADGNEGRPNPFAQFGNDVVSSGFVDVSATTPATTTSTTTTSTITPATTTSTTTPATTPTTTKPATQP